MRGTGENKRDSVRAWRARLGNLNAFVRHRAKLGYQKDRRYARKISAPQVAPRKKWFRSTDGLLARDAGKFEANTASRVPELPSSAGSPP